MGLLQICGVLVGLYLLSCAWTFYRNYVIARATGFSLYLSPVIPHNPLWMVFGVALQPMFARFLPTFAYDRIRRCIYGWEFREAQQAGIASPRPEPAFMLVTPGHNELWAENLEFANAILTRRKDFIQSPMASRVMGIFGPNLITQDGDDWQRTRKIVAPLLNERISDLVWNESSKQAKQMVEHFLATSQGITDETLGGLRSIAIHVLGSAGYGVSQPWKEEPQELHSGHKVSYIDALHAVVNDFILLILLPAKVLALPIMPKGVQKLGISAQEFPVYTKEMLERERTLAASSTQPRNNLMSTLVKASDEEKKQDTKNKMSQSLSEHELAGNLYLFSVAGFDTTANTLAYAITTLAANPDWQDWIIEEIDSVLEHDEAIDYETTFPKLGRCLALMYETLRVYPPVQHISRSTVAPQQLTHGSKTYYVPADTVVYVNIEGLHSAKGTWGDDSLVFRPSRWLTEKSTLENPSIITMPKGTFLPWSGGPRICPGMKMAQVEFLAVILSIFRKARVGPVTQGSETMEMARDRLKGLMKDSQPRITLQMNRPKDVVLRWVER